MTQTLVIYIVWYFHYVCSGLAPAQRRISQPPFGRKINDMDFAGSGSNVILEIGRKSKVVTDLSVSWGQPYIQATKHTNIQT